MGPARRSEPKRVVVNTYGRGGLLGLISVPFALVMAARGMNGWQQAAVREMEDPARSTSGGSGPGRAVERPHATRFAAPS